MKRGSVFILLFLSLTLVLALGGPTINWIGQTPDNGETIYLSNINLEINLTEATNLSTFFDFDESLVGYWNFENYNATGVYDNSSHDNFLLFSGSVGASSLVDSIYGEGMYFDGGNDKLQKDWDASFDKPTDGLTMSFWLKHEPMPNWDLKLLLARAYRTVWVNPYFEYGTSSHGVNSTHFKLGSRIDGVGHSYSDPLTYEEWHHIVITWNGSSQDVIFYIDNVVSGTFNEGVSSITYQYNAPFLVGLNLENQEDFNGSIDEIAIFSRTLSPEEINSIHYNTGLSLTKSFNNLSDGNYNYAAYAINSDGNLTRSLRNFTKDTVYPLIPSVSISSTDDEDDGDSDLNCSATIIHEIGHEMNATIGWYRNDILNLTMFFNNNYENGTLFESILEENPTEFKLDPPGVINAKDFSLYYEDEWYHLYYIKATAEWNAEFFGYQKSQDLSHWSFIDDVLGVDENSDWNIRMVWAPHVFKNNGTYFMFYTGIDNETGGDHTQRIGLATSSDLHEWTRYNVNNCSGTIGDGCVLDCNYSWNGWDEGYVWDGQCRDPYVFDDTEDTGYYYMVYTTSPIQWQQVVGLAKSTDLVDWEDVGPINRTYGGKAESPHIIKQNDTYYLFYSAYTNLKYTSTTNLTDLTLSNWGSATEVPNQSSQNYASELLNVSSNLIWGYIRSYNIYFQQFELNESTGVMEISNLNSSMVAGETNDGENWSCKIQLSSGEQESAWGNSSNLYLGDLPPSVVIPNSQASHYFLQQNSNSRLLFKVKIPRGREREIEINDYANAGITNLRIKAKEKINGNLEIKKINLENVTCELPTLFNKEYVEYRVLEIIHDNIPDEDIEEVELEIEVSKNWSELHGINELKIMRCKDTIQYLEPIELEGSDEYMKYSVTADGFSTWIIAGFKETLLLEIEEKNNSIEEENSPMVEQNQTSKEKFEDKSTNSLIYLLSFILVLILLIIIRLKRLKKSNNFNLYKSRA
jgi:predicted GH43/DUF377 family glycosyl hydrolase